MSTRHHIAAALLALGLGSLSLGAHATHYPLKVDNCGYTLEFSNRCFVTLEEEDIQKKIAALYEYNSQQACRTYVNEAYVRALALVRGTQIQKPLAEVFDVPRLILD